MVLTDTGPVEISVPCDRKSSSEPRIVAKRQRRLSGVDEMVISLSAKGLTHGEIAAQLAEVYGAGVSKQKITTIPDRVMEGMAEWQTRPLDPPIGLVFTSRDWHYGCDRQPLALALVATGGAGL